MEIEFIPTIEPDLLIAPEPAIKHLPQWYKDLKTFMGGEKKFRTDPDRNSNITVKWCNPFGDALGSGYFVLLENDLLVTANGDRVSFQWTRGGAEMITEHNPEQISPTLIPDEYMKTVWKFENFWGIKTPKGFSTLFTHPLNRTELPFITLSGVVETDGYNRPVNFPFILRKDFEGILPAGTPIVQLFPFKRENWKSKISAYQPKRLAQLDVVFFRKLFRVYKQTYWQRKEYR